MVLKKCKLWLTDLTGHNPWNNGLLKETASNMEKKNAKNNQKTKSMHVSSTQEAPILVFLHKYSNFWNKNGKMK
jgi:esterase/lipase superfamily enzyme